MKKLGIWLEITTLVIPQHNDSNEELEESNHFLVEVGLEIPWHVSAFYPTYKLISVGRTPASILKRARQIGLKTGLYYVYTDNMPGDEGENTFCNHCGKKIIERIGYTIGAVNIRDGKYKFCGTPVAGVWK